MAESCLGTRQGDELLSMPKVIVKPLGLTLETWDTSKAKSGLPRLPAFDVAQTHPRWVPPCRGTWIIDHERRMWHHS